MGKTQSSHSERTPQKIPAKGFIYWKSLFTFEPEFPASQNVEWLSKGYYYYFLQQKQVISALNTLFIIK